MGLGDFVTNLFGSKNTNTAASNAGAPPVDPNAYEYGGSYGGAAAQAGAYGATAADAQGRMAPGTDYNNSNGDMMQGAQARVGQGNVTDELARRGLGQGTTVAEILGKQAQQNAIAAQTAQAGSARGAAGLALAGQTAANGIANATGAIAGTTEANAAQERLNDLGAAQGGYTQMRAGDLGEQAQNAQQSQFTTTAQLNQNQLNDQRSLGYSGLQNQVNTTQLAAQGNKVAQRSANSLNAAGINTGVGQANASQNNQNGYGLVGMGATIGGAIAGGALGGPPKGAAARGGMIPRREPYLVAEKGPELVIPTMRARADGGYVAERGINPTIVGLDGPQLYAPPQNAYVIPADKTAQMLARPTSTWGTGRGIGPAADALNENHSSTWGTGPGVSVSDEDDAIRENQRKLERDKAAEERDNDHLATNGGGGATGAVMNPVALQNEKDKEYVTTREAYRANGVAPKDGEDEDEMDRQEGLARRRLGQDRKNARAALTPTGIVTSTLGTLGKNATAMAAPQRGGDYRGAPTYTANLQSVSARAKGGPVSAAKLNAPRDFDAPQAPTMAPQYDPMDRFNRDRFPKAPTMAPMHDPRDPRVMARAFGGPVYADNGADQLSGQGISNGALLHAMTGRTGDPTNPIGGGGIVGGGMPIQGMREDGGSVTSGAPRAGYEAMMVGAPAMMLTDSYRRSKEGKSGPDQRLSDLDAAAKIALGPVTGRALIQASTWTPEELAAEQAKREAAKRQADASASQPQSSSIGRFVSQLFAGRRQ